jgi:hypothetical protein
MWNVFLQSSNESLTLDTCSVELHFVGLCVLIDRCTMVVKGNEGVRSQHRTMCYAVSHKPSYIY